jgi:hypothetical protein
VWTVATDGTLRVRGLCLQPAGQSSANGAAMVVGVCDGSAAQQFQLAAGGRIRQAGLCVTIPGNTTADVQLTLNNCALGVGAQRWTAP